jgi:hypothetical protein
MKTQTGPTQLKNPADAPTASHTHTLSVRRLNVMRVGYAFMGIGLAVVKWPLLDDVHEMPLHEGLVTCLLVGLSLLALLGLRYPGRMLPVLMFEVIWKALWLALVAVPVAAAGDMSTEMQDVVVNCAFGVVVAAVIPWRHVWQRLVTGAGDPWRGGPHDGGHAGWLGRATNTATTVGDASSPTSLLASAATDSTPATSSVRRAGRR